MIPISQRPSSEGRYFCFYSTIIAPDCDKFGYIYINVFQFCEIFLLFRFLQSAAQLDKFPIFKHIFFSCIPAIFLIE